MATSNRGGKGRNGDRDKKLLDQALKPRDPVFPYPHDLPDEHKPIWLATVNTKTADYWNPSDVALLEIYCRCIADVRILTNDIKEEGDVIENARGNPVINPKIVVRGFAENRLMALCTKLRMQPQSRNDTLDSPAKGKKKAAAARAASVIGDDDDDLLGGAPTGPMQ